MGEERLEYWRRRLERPRLSDMVQDAALLAWELRRSFPDARRMPTRAALRAANRCGTELQICPGLPFIRFEMFVTLVDSGSAWAAFYG